MTTADKGYRRRVTRRARKANIALSDEVADRLAGYLDLLTIWNRRINLTSLEEPDTAVDRLVLEPMLAARFVPPASTVLDIGSGGGSPAIPLKIRCTWNRSHDGRVEDAEGRVFA